jgi:hypothetical protein
MRPSDNGCEGGGTLLDGGGGGPPGGGGMVGRKARRAIAEIIPKVHGRLSSSASVGDGRRARCGYIHK